MNQALASMFVDNKKFSDSGAVCGFLSRSHQLEPAPFLEGDVSRRRAAERRTTFTVNFAVLTSVAGINDGVIGVFGSLWFQF
jgi:hypothetical protein